MRRSYSTIMTRALLLASAGLLATPASAQEDTGKSDLNIMVGMGLKTRPSFPGSGENKIGALPVVNIWRGSEEFPVETPDESFGFTLIGKRGKTSFGPTLTFATQRKGEDAITGLSDVKFGVEAGGFAETYLGPMVRLRTEVRQGLGAHKGLTADGALDLIARSPGDKLVGTIGPRVRWGNSRYTRAYFGVGPQESVATGLAPYRPKGGLYAYGVMAGAYYKLSPKWGLFGFAGYDRLTGNAADSPIVTQIGSRNQFSTGIAATYTFQVKR